MPRRIAEIANLAAKVPVPIAAAGLMSAKILKNATLKVYPGFPHGMPATNADQINADLLAFLKGAAIRASA
jgi:pimeloyl-ACP methyl ester carboxylesterase